MWFWVVLWLFKLGLISSPNSLTLSFCCEIATFCALGQWKRWLVHSFCLNKAAGAFILNQPSEKTPKDYYPWTVMSTFFCPSSWHGLEWLRWKEVSPGFVFQVILADCQTLIKKQKNICWDIIWLFFSRWLKQIEVPVLVWSIHLSCPFFVLVMCGKTLGKMSLARKGSWWQGVCFFYQWSSKFDSTSNSSKPQMSSHFWSTCFQFTTDKKETESMDEYRGF